MPTQAVNRPLIAQKAIYGDRVIRKIRLFNLSISWQFDLYEKIVLPVLIYECEIIYKL